MFENQPATGQVGGRQFIYMLTGFTMTLGMAFAAWPLIDSMNPSAGALTPVVSVDLDRIPPGDWQIIHWREFPILVAHRTPEQIAAAQHGDDADLLFPETDRERVQRDAWLVVAALCSFGESLKEREPPHDGRWPGRWTCSYGARYDDSGRLRSNWGYENFPVPPYYFQSDRWLIIGDETGQLGLYPFPAPSLKYRVRDKDTKRWLVISE